MKSLKDLSTMLPDSIAFVMVAGGFIACFVFITFVVIPTAVRGTGNAILSVFSPNGAPSSALINSVNEP